MCQMATQPDIKPSDNINYKIEGEEAKHFPLWKLFAALGAVLVLSAAIFGIAQLIRIL